MKRRKGKKETILTERRIHYLHDLAVSSQDKEPEYSTRYIEMMENTAKRMDYTIPQNIKKSYCKNCRNLYGSDAKIRLKKGIIHITCGNCGNVRRIPY